MKSVFAKNMVRARNQWEWTQQTAAERIGIKRATLASYEEGRAEPAFEILEKIIRAYEIRDLASFLYSPEFLLDGSPEVIGPSSEVEQRYKMIRGAARKAVDVLLGIRSS